VTWRYWHPRYSKLDNSFAHIRYPWWGGWVFGRQRERSGPYFWFCCL